MKAPATLIAESLETRGPSTAQTRDAQVRSQDVRTPSDRRQMAWWSGQLKTLLLPPTGLIWPGIVGLILLRTPYADAGFLLLLTVFASQLLLGTPAVQHRLLSFLDRYPPIVPAAEKSAWSARAAIVVLDAGRRPAAREYGGDGVKPKTLERLRHAAWLHRALDLPILAAGNGAGTLMRDVCEESFNVPVRWCETRSRNTLESAELTVRFLESEHIERIYLVTHFWHMPRALAAFDGACRADGPKIAIRPAPMGFHAPEAQERGLGAFIPRLTALEGSYWAIHELIGLAWYRLRQPKKLKTF